MIAFFFSAVFSSPKNLCFYEKSTSGCPKDYTPVSPADYVNWTSFVEEENEELTIFYSEKASDYPINITNTPKQLGKLTLISEKSFEVKIEEISEIDNLKTIVFNDITLILTHKSININNCQLINLKTPEKYQISADNLISDVTSISCFSTSIDATNVDITLENYDFTENYSVIFGKTSNSHISVHLKCNSLIKYVLDSVVLSADENGATFNLTFSATDTKLNLFLEKDEFKVCNVASSPFSIFKRTNLYPMTKDCSIIEVTSGEYRSAPSIIAKDDFALTSSAVHSYFNVKMLSGHPSVSYETSGGVIPPILIGANSKSTGKDAKAELVASPYGGKLLIDDKQTISAPLLDMEGPIDINGSVIIDKIKTSGKLTVKSLKDLSLFATVDSSTTIEKLSNTAVDVSINVKGMHEGNFDIVKAQEIDCEKSVFSGKIFGNTSSFVHNDFIVSRNCHDGVISVSVKKYEEKYTKFCISANASLCSSDEHPITTSEELAKLSDLIPDADVQLSFSIYDFNNTQIMIDIKSNNQVAFNFRSYTNDASVVLSENTMKLRIPSIVSVGVAIEGESSTPMTRIKSLECITCGVGVNLLSTNSTEKELWKIPFDFTTFPSKENAPERELHVVFSHDVSIKGTKFTSDGTEKDILFKNLFVTTNSGLKVTSDGDLKLRSNLGGSVYAEAKNIDVAGFQDVSVKLTADEAELKCDFNGILSIAWDNSLNSNLYAPSNSKITFVPSAHAKLNNFILTVADNVALNASNSMNSRFAVSEYHVEGDSTHKIPAELSPIKLFVGAGSMVSCAALEDLEFLELDYQPAQFPQVFVSGIIKEECKILLNCVIGENEVAPHSYLDVPSLNLVVGGVTDKILSHVSYKSDNYYYSSDLYVTVVNNRNTLCVVKKATPEPTKPHSKTVAPEPTSDSYKKNNIVFSVSASCGGVVIAVIVVAVVLCMKKKSAQKGTVIPDPEPLITKQNDI